jgi:hypothetical protein
MLEEQGQPSRARPHHCPEQRRLGHIEEKRHDAFVFRRLSNAVCASNMIAGNRRIELLDLFEGLASIAFTSFAAPSGMAR